LPSPWIPLLLPIVSWFSIFVFSFAREPLLNTAKLLMRADSKEKVKRAITVAQLVIGGIAAIALSLISLGKIR
jgi:amino acid permease